MIEREQIEMDVVFVGAGPANLAAALHLKKEIVNHDEMIDKGLKFGNKVGELPDHPPPCRPSGGRGGACGALSAAGLCTGE